MKKVLAKVWLVGFFLCLGHGTAWAADLRLNPDGIKAISTSVSGDFYFKDVFSGTPINECTLQDIVDCIRKYTSVPAYYSEKDVEVGYIDREKGIVISLSLYPYFGNYEEYSALGDGVYEAIGGVYDENKMAEEFT